MANFNAGDVCGVHTPNNTTNHGKTVKLIKAITPAQLREILLAEFTLNLGVPDETIWEVDEKVSWRTHKMPLEMMIPYANEGILRKLEDDRSTVSWDECIWRPKDLHVKVEETRSA